MRQLAFAVLALAMLSASVLSGGCATAATSGGGKTVTGKVLSFTDSSLTLETTTGNEVIGITSATEGRDHLLVGASVAVDVQRSPGPGEPVATRIRPAGGG